LSSFQHSGLALDVQGVRAYQAARAGMEWGLYQTVTAATSSCSSGGGEVALSATTLQEMTVTVRCQQIASEDGQTLYTVDAWACNRPASASPKCPGDVTVDGYIERKLSAVVAK
jgi:MSHA biogenesis protein MshP